MTTGEALKLGQDRRASVSAAVVDAHVHLHDCFTDESFFDNAGRNLGEAADRLGLEAPIGVLLLTEPGGVDHYARLASRRSVGRWDILDTREVESLLVVCSTMTLVLVAGRQIATSDGFEVLALGTRERFEDGRAATETLREVIAAGALAILPWGFGKWWFRRGSLVRKILLTGEVDGLGDNGGRTWLLGEPPNFRIAKELGVPILPGSDPLPYPGEVRRVGSYGFCLETSLSRYTAAADLRRAIRAPGTRIAPFGSRRGPAPFLWAQLRMQLRRRMSVA